MNIKMLINKKNNMKHFKKNLIMKLMLQIYSKIIIKENNNKIILYYQKIRKYSLLLA